MADVKRDTGLRTIFSFFLGLMLTAFVGVGVFTFHPPPQQFERQIRELNQRDEVIRNARRPAELSAAEQEQIQEISRQRRSLMDAAAEARKPWALSTSIVLIVFATIAMAVSLVRAQQLPVISNGLLLGGLFAMLYGVGWVIATGTSVTRFLVMTAALAITLALGYVRFVRRAATFAEAGPAISGSEGLTQLEGRVRELETRMTEASHALGRDRIT